MGLSFPLQEFARNKKSHILTLSFDDGFKKSFYRIAEIHENYGLKACLNIIASAHTPCYSPPNEYMLDEVGNFNDWNLLKSRGHEIMPHSWNHRDLTEMPLNQAKEDIDKCISFFQENLNGFKANNAIYNFAYNASTKELEDFALTRVRGIRTGAWHIAENNQTWKNGTNLQNVQKVGCTSFGPGNADHWVENQVSQFLTSAGGWLVLNLHGLDNEGWGSH